MDNDNGKDIKFDELKAVIREVLDEYAGDPKALLAQKAKRVQEQEVVTDAEQRILNSIHWLEEVTGKVAHEPQYVAHFAKFSGLTSPLWIESHKSLRRKGLLTRVHGGYMQLTMEGRDKSQPRNAILRRESTATEA